MTADDYLNTKPEQLREMERAAYASGDTDRAALLDVVVRLLEQVQELDDMLGN